MIILRVGDNPADYKVEEEISIEDASAKYGLTNDSIQIYDDNHNLLCYSVWKQGENQYSFCHNPYSNVAPSDWDILK